MRKKKNPWKEHSLSIVIGTFLILWIVLYSVSNEKKHLGAFYGNAIADWTGILTMVLVTKNFYEKGSAESKNPRKKNGSRVAKFFTDHSLSIFIVVTGLIWIALFVKMDCQSKWGQVVGNIVSEWTQIFCLVVFTKKLVERHSKESKA